MNTVYYASIGYLSPVVVRGDGPITESMLQVRYLAASHHAAAEAAIRFWNARQVAWPEQFGAGVLPLSIKLYTCNHDEIDAKGVIQQELRGPILEWKCDFPWSLDQAVDKLKFQDTDIPASDLHQMVATRRGGDWMVYSGRDSTRWGCGKYIVQAIGDCILTHHKYFGIELVGLPVKIPRDPETRLIPAPDATRLTPRQVPETERSHVVSYATLSPVARNGAVFNYYTTLEEAIDAIEGLKSDVIFVLDRKTGEWKPFNLKD